MYTACGRLVVHGQLLFRGRQEETWNVADQGASAGFQKTETVDCPIIARHSTRLFANASATQRQSPVLGKFFFDTPGLSTSSYARVSSCFCQRPGKVDRARGAKDQEKKKATQCNYQKKNPSYAVAWPGKCLECVGVAHSFHSTARTLWRF